MPRGRTYELKAVFSAENKAGRTIASLEKRLKSLQDRIEKLSKQDADIGISEHGGAATAARVEELTAKVKKFDGMDAEAKVGVSESDIKRSYKQLDNLTRRITKLTERPNNIDLNVDSKTAERRIRELAAEARELSRKAYVLELKAEADNLPEVMAQARKLKQTADEVNGQRMQLIADIKNVPQVLRDAGLMKVAMNELDGTYTIKVNYRSLLSARGALKGAGAAVGAFAGFLRSAQPLSQSFAQKVYIMQQAMSVFRTAILAVAVAAAGPLVAGLTILGASLIAAAGGFGLVLMAAAPLISFFANARQRAQDLEQAQSDLSSAQDTAASSARAVADAQRGVGDAYRSGQEQIQGAIQAHADSVRALTDAQRAYKDSVAGIGQAEKDAHEGVRSAIEAHKDAVQAITEAQRAYQDAVRGVGEAERSAHESVRAAIQTHEDALRGVADAQDSYADAQQAARDATLDVRLATQEYNTALATEQFRLRSMQLDIQGMRLSQKQLAFDMRDARRELENAETPREQREAQLRLQQLELQRKQNILDMGAAQRELNSAQKKGTDELQGAADARKNALEAQKDAQQGVVDALKGVAEAQRNAMQSEREIAKARREGARAVADAQRSVAEAQRGITDAMKAERAAQRGITKARADGNQQIREAQKAAQDAGRAVAEAMRNERRAQKDIGKARADAARQMADANRQLAQANADMAEAQADVRAKQSALDKLLEKQPRHLRDMMNAVQNFKDEYKVAFADAQVSTARLATRLIDIGTRNLPALGNAADRTAEGLNKALSNIGRNFRNFGAINSLHKILKSMPNITKNWTQAIGNFGGAFLNIMGEAMPFARRLAKNVKDVSRNFLEWTDSKKGREEIKTFFKSAAPVAKALWHEIKRIGGGLLHWSTQSKKGPERIAQAIHYLGNTVMFVVHAVHFLIRVWKLLPGPIKTALKWVTLTYLGMRILFGTRVANAIIGLGAKVVKFGWSFIFANKKIGVLRGGIGRLTEWATLQWFRMGYAFEAITAQSIRGVIASFGPFAIAIGLAAWYLVNAFKRAYTSITQTTPKFASNLVQMHKNGAISSGQMWISAFRFAMAETYKVVVGAMLDIKKTIANVLGHIPGLGGIMDQWKKDATEDMNDIYKTIAGKTAMAAKDMKSNTKDGTSGATKNMNMWENSTYKTMNKAADNTHDDLFAMKNAMVKQTQEGGNKGSNNMDAFKSNGSGSMKDLFKNADMHLGNMKSASNDYTEKMKNTGVDNFWDFNQGGTNAADDLNTAASLKMAKMQIAINRATNDTQHKGVADLTAFKEGGNKQLEEAHKKWTGEMSGTSSGMQGALNDIISGLGKFIKAVDIDTKPPEQFTVQAHSAKDMSGHYGFAKGGVMKYASGGVQGPTGGVSNGTTRVYGEIPGTTEFYITDNKKHRKRNMEILQAANQHMNMAAGGTMVHDERTGEYKVRDDDVEAVRVPRGKIDLTGGDHKLGLNGPMVNDALRASKLWKAPSVFERGRDARVFRGSGIGSARTSSLGDISVNKGFNGSLLSSILAHEEGHALNMGHSKHGIMRKTLHGPTKPSTKELKWVHENYEKFAKSGGGKGHSGGGSSSSDKKEDKLSKREQHEQTAKERRKALRAARRFRHSFNSHRSTHGPLADSPDYSRNAQWMSRGGEIPIPGTPKMVDENFKRIGKLHSNERGQDKPAPRRRAGEVIEAYDSSGATTHNWYPWVQSKVDEMAKEFKGKISMNTYVGHGNAPGGGSQNAERQSVDHWGPGGRGDHIAKPTGDSVANYATSNWKDDIYYYIWQGMIHGWGRVKPYPDKSDQHFDHVHITYSKGGSPGGIGAGSGDSGPSLEEVQKKYDKLVPSIKVPEHHTGFRSQGLAADKVAQATREMFTQKAASSGSTSSGGEGSAAGMKIIDAAHQAGWTGADAKHIAAIAYRESGLWEDASPQHPPPGGYYHDSNYANGDPSIGLIQMIGSYAKQQWHMKSLEEAQKRLMLGLDNLGLAKQLHADQGWGPWTTQAGWSQGLSHIDEKVKRHGKGGMAAYSNGGVVTRPHMGLIGDNGPEVNIPLHDPRALNMIRKAFDMSERVSGSAAHRYRATVQADNANRSVDKMGRKDTERLDFGKRNDHDIGQMIKDAIHEMKKEVVDAIKKDTKIDDESIEKQIEVGMRLMHKMMKDPHIGGKITNQHIEDDVLYQTQLRKK